MSFVKENLLFFLKNGYLENFPFGISKFDLIEKLGEPEFESEKRGDFQYLEYNCVEFYFQSEKLVNVLIYPNRLDESSRLKFENYGWNIDSTLDDVITFLKNHQIEFEEKSYQLEFYRLFKTENDVEIYFTNQESENVWLLHCLGKTIENEVHKL